MSKPVETREVTLMRTITDGIFRYGAAEQTQRIWRTRERLKRDFASRATCSPCTIHVLLAWLKIGKVSGESIRPLS